VTFQWTSEDPTYFNAGDDNLRRYVGNNPANAADPSGLEKLDLRKAIDKFNSFPRARDLLKEAARLNGREKIEIVLKDNMDFLGIWDSGNKEIWVRSDQDIDTAVSTILFETIRAIHNKEREEITADATAGKYSRNDFAIKKEHDAFKYITEYREIAKQAVENKIWDEKSYEYREVTSFEIYLKANDTPKPGKGVDDTHTGYFRKIWDELYKTAWEKRQKQLEDELKRNEQMRKEFEGEGLQPDNSLIGLLLPVPALAYWWLKGK
jgi:hypothetical protein